MQETYKTVQVRVLHPLIPEIKYTKVLYGLPEGSKLSPPLFGVFISELITELQAKFPNAVIYAFKGSAWAGAIAFVDE